jgi:hypothetical protein
MGRLVAALLLPAVFPLFHICYGAGLLRGVAAPRFRKRGESDCEVTIRRVKEFGGSLEKAITCDQ